MKELIGKKVTRIVELTVDGKLKVFGEILKQTNFKTGNKAVTFKVDGIVTDVTVNSIEVKSNKWTENGVNAKQWFSMSEFEKIFKIED
jgi:hypothetical protein